MQTVHLKRVLARFWRMSHSEAPRRIILYYHAVGPGPLAMAANQFRCQMEWLSTHADVVTFGQVLSGAGKSPIQVAITFDDGYASVISEAFPIMHSLGIAGTVFVNTGWIGDAARLPSNPSRGHYPGEDFMTWEDLRELAKRGWTIGSHGVEHVDLTAASEQDLSMELRNSRTDIQARLGGECSHFAYTWGRYDQRVRRAVMATGYKTASSAIHGPVTAASDAFVLPRIDVSRQYSMEDFRDIVAGHWDFLGAVQVARRRLTSIRDH